MNPESRGEPTAVAKTWRSAQGLADDVRRYGQWMRDEAEKRIGHLYPRVEVTSALVRPSYIAADGGPRAGTGKIARYAHRPSTELVGAWR